MKKIFLILIMLCGFSISNAEISYISESSSWYKQYDGSGKQKRSFSTSNGKLVGYSSHYYILKDNSWYKIYNENGTMVRSLSISSIGKIISVTESGFVAETNSWINFYNFNGQKISSRSK